MPNEISVVIAVVSKSGNCQEIREVSLAVEHTQVLAVEHTQVLALASLAQVLVCVQLAHSVQIEMKSVTSM